MTIIIETNLPLDKPFKGKVRDTYVLNDKLLIIATDRISAFDYILPNGIPDKGRVLNQISAFWFNKTRHIIPNHLITAVDSIEILNELVHSNKPLPDYLIGRSMLVHKAKRINIEAVVRGYLSGSAWADYKKTGIISGIHQSISLKESEKLAEPLFTPTTKADIGHDMPINKQEMHNQFGKELSDLIEIKSIEVYQFAQKYALNKGIILADTKFEFGFLNDTIILIDEILTPDSSRFWDASKYEVGTTQPSFDKQPVRDWLETSGWNKIPPVPSLPNDIVQKTSKRYKTAYKMITGLDIGS
jgi:phosphoribosylaminoimidazole-succinocarboxamide synthase